MRRAFGPAALLLLLASLASPSPAQTCSIQCCADGSVSIDEVVRMVSLSLNGCQLVEPTATPTRPPGNPHQPGRFTDLGDGTVRDDAFGVVWETKGRTGGLHDQDRLFTHDEAVLFLGTLNQQRFGGRRNWRLPTFEELISTIASADVPPGQPYVLFQAFDSDCQPGCAPATCRCWPQAWVWMDGEPAQSRFSAFDVHQGYGESFPGSTPLRARAVAALP